MNLTQTRPVPALAIIKCGGNVMCACVQLLYIIIITYSIWTWHKSDQYKHLLGVISVLRVLVFHMLYMYMPLVILFSGHLKL